LASPEILHQPRTVFGPDDESGSDLIGQPKYEFPQLKGIDFGDRESWDKAVTVASELRTLGAEDLANSLLGLPEGTPEDEADRYIYHQEAIYVARHYGLPDDTPVEVIDKLIEAEEMETYRATARSLGLPEDATGDQISEKERQMRAQKVELPEDAKWGEIWRAEEEQMRKAIFEVLGIREDDTTWDWEDVLRRALCVSYPETPEAYIERIQEIREWRIAQLVKEQKG
jgi:hypothetical protein